MQTHRIIDYFFREYLKNNQYDINQLILNKSTKFTNYTLLTRRNYLAWQGRIEIWRTVQRLAFIICWWILAGGVGFSFIFFGSIELAAGQTGYELLNAWTWSCFGLFWFFILLGSFLYFYPIYQYKKINKVYLPKLISIFQKMQQEGYIDPTIEHYPSTIQTIYYHGKWYKAWKDKDYPFKHYCMWFGFLSLRYFIEQYQKLNLPILSDESTPNNKQ